MSHKNKIIQASVLTLLSLLIVLQANSVWKDIVQPWFHDYSGILLMSAPHRDAVMYLGEDRARYLRFLDAYLPQDAAIVIPPDYVFLSSQNVMQNFLFPRPILACFGRINASLAAQCLNDPHNYVLAIDNFPPPDQVPGRVFVAYPQADSKLRGVYVPRNAAGQLEVPPPGKYGKTSPVSARALLVDVLLVALTFVLGGLATQVILGLVRWADLLELGIPLGMGFFTWFLFLVTFAGARVTAWTGIALYLVLLCTGLALHYGVYRRLPQISDLSWRGAVTTLRGTPRSSLLPWLLLGASLLAMGFLAVANGYSDFDSIANWSLKGYAIAGTGDILAGARWGGHVLSYPMNLALSIAMFKLADGDLIPGSKLLYAVLTASLLLGCYRFLVRRDVSQTIAVVAALALLTTPIFFRNSISGLANLPFTAYLVLGILHSVDGVSKLDVRQTLLGGLLLAFAAWTRPEGLMFGLAFSVLLYALAFLIGRTRASRSLLLSSFLPMLIIPMSWMVLVGGAAMSGDQIGQSLRQFTTDVLHGNLHPEAALLIVDFARASLLNTKTFGYVAGACALAILTTLPLTRWYRDPNRLIFSLLTILTLLLPALLFFVAYFREQDFNAFLHQSFDRAYLPALIMSILTAILALTYHPELPATASDAQIRPTDVGSVR